MTSIRNTNYYEMGLVNPMNEGTFTKIYTNYADGYDAVDENGCVYAPTGPGLGAELDWDYIKKHETDRLKIG